MYLNLILHLEKLKLSYILFLLFIEDDKPTKIK